MRYLVLLSLVASALMFAPAVNATTDSTEVCVTIYEDYAQSGDRVSFCDFATALHVSNLSNVTSGINGKCNSKYPSRSGWNDCASPDSTYVNLPPSYRIVFYKDSNYGGGRTGCVDSFASGHFYMTNDETTSIRVEGGNC